MAAAGVWSAPGRVNLIGEHTDYNLGLALPFAIDDRTFASVALRTDGMLHLSSLQQLDHNVSVALDELAPGFSPTGWAAYVAGAIWAARGAGYPVTGVDLQIDGRVPRGAGLGSSHAMQCAALLALNDLLQWNCSRTDLARLTQVSENEFVGVPTGLMDPLASLCAQAGHAMLVDFRCQSVEQLSFVPSATKLCLLVIDTGVHHDNTEGAYGERRRSCVKAATTLGVPALRDVSPTRLDDALDQLSTERDRALLRHVVNEDLRVQDTAAALKAQDWPTVGRLMTASHVSLRDDYQVSCPELDVAVDVSLASGALGARMTGGGFGGCAIALVPRLRSEDLIAQVSAAFREQEWSAPSVFEVHASAGARREDRLPEGTLVRPGS